MTRGGCVRLSEHDGGTQRGGLGQCGRTYLAARNASCTTSSASRKFRTCDSAEPEAMRPNRRMTSENAPKSPAAAPLNRRLQVHDRPHPISASIQERAVPVTILTHGFR